MQLFRATQENEVNIHFTAADHIIVFSLRAKMSSINILVDGTFDYTTGQEEVEAICQDSLNSRIQSVEVDKYWEEVEKYWEEVDKLRNTASQSESSSIPPTVEDQSHLQAHNPQQSIGCKNKEQGDRFAKMTDRALLLEE